MNLRKLILINNDCYKSNKQITPKGIMIHSTGANNPNLSRYIGPDDGLLGHNKNNNHWNMSGVGACVHAFIGKLKDSSIATYQTLPWNWRGWHAGSSANNTHIGFEICEDNLEDSEYFIKVYQEAAELCAYLCELYNLDPLAPGVLICHSEGYKLGVATNHSDVMHWFPKHGKSMDDFRKLVKSLIDVVLVPENMNIDDEALFLGGYHYSSANATSGVIAPLHRVRITQIYKSGKYPYHVRSIDSNGNFIPGVYGWVAEDSLILENVHSPTRQVKVITDKLNIRSGPSTSYKIVGTIEDRGVYTIVEELDGWGKLKSKLGWISLKYAKEL